MNNIDLKQNILQLLGTATVPYDPDYLVNQYNSPKFNKLKNTLGPNSNINSDEINKNTPVINLNNQTSLNNNLSEDQTNKLYQEQYNNAMQNKDYPTAARISHLGEKKMAEDSYKLNPQVYLQKYSPEEHKQLQNEYNDEWEGVIPEDEFYKHIVNGTLEDATNGVYKGIGNDISNQIKERRINAQMNPTDYTNNFIKQQ